MLESKKMLKKLEADRYMLECREERYYRQVEKAHKMSQSLSDMPKGGGGEQQDDRLNALIDERNAIDAAWARYSREQAAAIEQISALGDVKYEQMFMLRYMDGLAWRDVAKRMSYSLDGIYSLHGRGLKLLDDKMHSSAQ